MSDLVYAQREIDNLVNLLADARTENMRLNEYIKRQAMDILLCKSGNDTLHEENTRLRAALRPFADALKGYWSMQPGSMKIVAGPWASDLRLELTLVHFRNASYALEEGRT